MTGLRRMQRSATANGGGLARNARERCGKKSAAGARGARPTASFAPPAAQGPFLPPPPHQAGAHPKQDSHKVDAVGHGGHRQRGVVAQEDGLVGPALEVLARLVVDAVLGGLVGVGQLRVGASSRCRAQAGARDDAKDPLGVILAKQPAPSICAIRSCGRAWRSPRQAAHRRPHASGQRPDKPLKRPCCELHNVLRRAGVQAPPRAQWPVPPRPTPRAAHSVGRP